MGFLLEEAAACGFSARGIEVNRREVAMTRARGLDVRWGTLEATGLPSASVDVVCMSHVLEHVTDLRGALAEVHRVLRPGGILAVAQPYYGAPLPLLLPRHWYGWQPGQHVWHFDPRALERVLAACELQRIALAYNSMHHSWVTRPLSLRPKIATVQAAVAAVAAVARVETRLGRGDQFYLAASAT